MNCDVYREIRQVITVCLSMNRSDESGMLKCLKKLFFQLFCQRSKSWFWVNSINKFNNEEIFQDAFNLGLTKVWAKGRENKLDQSRPTEVTVIGICMMQLKGLVTADNRYTSKNSRPGELEQLIEKASYNHNVYSMTDAGEEGKKRQEYELLEKAFAQLSERCQQLITWRKLLKLKNEDIAKKLGIDPGTVTNEVYRSMCRLKNNVDQLKAKIGQ